MLLEVATHDHWFVPRLVDTTAVERGKLCQSGPATITDRGGHPPKPRSAREVYRFAVSWLPGESISLVARWLHAKVQGKAERIRINRREVLVGEGDILRALQEATSGPGAQ